MSLTEPFRVKTYLHSEKESIACAVVEAVGDHVYQELPEAVQKDLLYMLYEVEFEINIDPLTGRYTILSVTDGDQVLVPRSNYLLQQ